MGGDVLTFDAGVDDFIGLITDAINQQHCILFLGAGVHAPPPDQSPFEYPAEQRPPIGAALSEKLAVGCKLSEQYPKEDARNLQRVALFYEIARSRRQLVQAVSEQVQTGKQPSPMLRALAELSFPLVITTNYDQLFENALRAADKDPRVAVYRPKPEAMEDYRNPTAQSPIVFKIHGDIQHPESIVITDEDYIQFVLRMSDKEPYDPIPLMLRFHLTEWVTLFVGYSLLDYNLRLLFKTLRWKIDNANAPEMYSVDHRPDPLIMAIWSNQRQYVRFIAQDVWTFVPQLYARARGKELQPSLSSANVR
jgi:SIR2-like domain